MIEWAKGGDVYAPRFRIIGRPGVCGDAGTMVGGERGRGIVNGRIYIKKKKNPGASSACNNV